MSQLYNFFHSVPPPFLYFSYFHPPLGLQTANIHSFCNQVEPLPTQPPNDPEVPSQQDEDKDSLLSELEEAKEKKKRVRRIQNMRDIRVKRDENFCERNQNKDRNNISYILKGYVHLVCQSKQVTQMVKTVSEKLNIQSGVSSFFHYVQRKFPSKKTYVGLRYMRSLLLQSRQDKMAYMLALTLRYYLKIAYPLIVLQKQQMPKKSKLKFLRKAKEIQAFLLAKKERND